MVSVLFVLHMLYVGGLTLDQLYKLLEKDDARTRLVAATELRRSLGRSTERRLPLEISDLGPYLKFVNRENECFQCLEMFQAVYEELHQMTKKNDHTVNVDGHVDTFRSSPLSSRTTIDNGKRKYLVVICGGAPGVGTRRNDIIHQDIFSSASIASYHSINCVICCFLSCMLSPCVLIRR